MGRRFLLLIAVAGLAGCDVRPPPAPGTRSDSRDPFGRSSSAAGGTAEPEYASALALVVGVSSYSAGSLGALEGPPFDAAEIANVLASRFGFRVDLLTDRAPKVSPAPGVSVDVRPVTLATLEAKLDAQAASPRSAFLFYFAGHGLPKCLVPSDAVLPSAADRSTWRNVLGFDRLAAKLRAVDAHHTLAILDCCFSGTALPDDGGFKKSVGTLGAPALRASEKDNLARVFNRRAFQVLTAGAGDETVGDLAQVSRRYADLHKDLEGHSPFTGVLLQGLRGLTGRADGRISATDLGHFLSHTLVNENESFRARQSPRFGTFGGEGDFLFVPRGAVLNPKLVAPLYMAGVDYAGLRASAASSLAGFVASKPEPALAGEAVPHLARLLRDEHPDPRRMAALSLERIGSMVDPAEVAAFRAAMAPLTLAAAPDSAIRAEAAAAIGRLAIHADGPAADAMSSYVSSLAEVWSARSAKRRIPKAVAARAAAIPPIPVAEASPADRTAAEERRRGAYLWLATEGLAAIADAERRHELGRGILLQAERHLKERRIVEARIGAARSIGFDGYGGPVSGHPPLLAEDSTEYWRARAILDTTPDVRLLWSVGGSRHTDAGMAWASMNPSGTLLATGDGPLGRGAPVKVWDLATGAVRTTIPTSGGRPFFLDDTTLALRDYKGRVRIHDAPSGTRVAWWDSGIEGIGLHHAPGTTVIGLAGGGRVGFWDWKAQRMLRELPVSPDASALVSATVFVASTSTPGELAIHDPSAEGPPRLVKVGDSIFKSLTLLDAGRLLLHDEEGTLRTWTPGTDPVPIREGVEGWVAFVAAGGAAVAVDSPGEFAVLRLADGTKHRWSGSRTSAWTGAAGTRLLARIQEGRITLFDALTAREINRPLTDDLRIETLDFSPDGSRLAAAADDGVVLRDPATGRLLARRLAPTYGFAFCGDGAAALADDRLVWLDGLTLDERHSTRLPGAASARMAVDPSRSRLAVALGPRVSVWSAAERREVGGFAVESDVRYLAWDPAGRTLAIGLKSGLQLHRADSGEKLWSVPDSGFGVSFDPTREEIAVSQNYDRATVYSTVNGAPVRVWNPGQGLFRCLRHHPEGRFLAGGNILGGFSIWSSDGRPWILESGIVPDSSVVALSPDGRLLALGGAAGLWMTWIGQEERTAAWTGRSPAPIAAVRSDGRGIAAAGNDGRDLVEVDVESGLASTRVSDLTSPIVDAAYDSEGVAWLALLDGSVLRSAVWGRAEPAAPAGLPGLVRLFPVRGRLVAIDAAGGVRVREASGGSFQPLWTPAGKSEPERPQIAFAPDAGAIVWADGIQMRLFDGSVRDGGRISVRPRALAVTPDASTVAWSGGEGPVEICAIDGRPLARLGPESTWFGMAFSPDGRLLAALSNSGTLHVWDWRAGTLLRSWGGSGSGAATVSFLPDGRRLATASHEGDLRIWNLDDPAARLSEALAHVEFGELDLKWRPATGASLFDTASPSFGGRPGPLMEASATRRLADLLQVSNWDAFLALLPAVADDGTRERIAAYAGWTALQDAYGRLGQLQPSIALRRLDVAERLGRRPAPMVRFAAAFGAHDDAAAMEALAACTSMDPLTAALFRIQLLLRMNRRAEAIALREEAEKLRGKYDADAGGPRVLTLLATGDETGLWDGLAEGASTYVRFHVGMHLARIGDPGARAHLEKVVEEAGRSYEAVMAACELKRLKKE